MGRDLTTSSASHQDSGETRLAHASWRLGDATLPNAARLLAAMALGALLLALIYQIPVTHTVDIGGYDSAYVQGFYDPERVGGQDRPELAGSDGSARWSRAASYLLFPQAGLPAQLTLRLRGWRMSGPAPRVTVLLNGTTVIGQFQASAGWEDHTVQIGDGILKPNDVVIEIRSEAAQIRPGDPRALGVLLDRATYHAGPAPIVPYPPQLLYGALAAGMLYILLRRPSLEPRTENRAPAKDRAWPLWLIGALVLSFGFLVLYRAQPLYPYPLLRLLPAIDAALAALLAIRYGPALARRVPALADALAIGSLGLWVAATLVVMRSHVTLSIPSVEKDFRVFALRSANLVGSFPAGTTNPELDGVLRADGFYNLGYPLLLWLARPLAGQNPFLAARLIAALSGALLLAAGWRLARRLLGRGPALLTLLLLALSPLVVEYALYVGTDMPFAALCTLALALLAGRSTTKEQAGGAPFVAAHSPFIIIVAGLAAGAAFLIRHPGLLLLPFGWLAIWQSSKVSVKSAALPGESSKLKAQSSKFMLLFTLAFVLAILPQLAVNIRDTGQLFYSQQAKNVWQAMFGDGDWGRWAETANDISLGQVIAQDPGRFLTNWWVNLRGYFGSGGEDTREFGQSVQLRMLGFPANWLAIGGLLAWLASGLRRFGPADWQLSTPGASSPDRLASMWLLIWIALYVVTISVGLPLQSRFFLPLAPIYALAAAWAVTKLRPANDHRQLSTTHYALRHAPLIASLALLALLSGGFAIGASYVLRERAAGEAELARAENRAELPGQPADEVRIIQLIQATLQPGERLLIRADPRVPIGKYSAIAHLALPAPATDDPAALRASGARYLLWDASLGAAPAVGSPVDGAGSYMLYRIDQ
jgi:4-amino-4-deoxy-L-arabinose transferase-like glycosyltransferase